MALEPIETVQLWVATVAGLAGLGALLWQAYDWLGRPRLRFGRSWGRLRSWCRVEGQDRTLYGVYIEYTGRQRAGSVTVDCELPDWRWRGQFADKGHISVSAVENKELVWLFSVDETDTISFEAADAHPTSGFYEPPTFSGIHNQQLSLHLRSNNVEGSDVKIKAGNLIRRARNLPD